MNSLWFYRHLNNTKGDRGSASGAVSVPKINELTESGGKLPRFREREGSLKM